MRTVDADALMKAMYNMAFETDGDTMWNSGCWVRYRAVERVVKEQPTVEPKRRTGKWIDGKCNQCGEHAPYWAMASTYHLSNFCTNCGSYNGENGESE